MRVLRKALQNQQDDILGFAQVLDDKLNDIAQQLKTPLPLVREMCLLFRKQPTSNAYWPAWNQLQQKLSGQFHSLYEAVRKAMKQTPRVSSMVENLNSRLRNYFFLRKQLGSNYLTLLQFFLNSRQFMRSECEERVGKSPTELMTGESHPNWLELKPPTFLPVVCKTRCSRQDNSASKEETSADDLYGRTQTAQESFDIRI